MRKILCASVMAGLLGISALASASPLVTPNVPLDSEYYTYLDKMEAMGYIEDMATNARPYSRLQVATWLAELNPAGMPLYLRVHYNEMVEDLAEEIAYVQQGDNTASFGNTLGLKNMETSFTYVDADHTSYAYKGQRVNASWQPLNKNNNGYRYGDGANFVGKLNISGNLNEDWALSLTPRFSYDDDQHGDASLEEGYVKSHLGVWGIEAGKMPLQWGGRQSSLAYSNNATPHTMVKLNLLEPYEIEHGFFRFLGKANVNVFYSQMEGNRRAKAEDFSSLWQREDDHAHLIGVRMDFVPQDYFTFGLERISMLRGFDSDWITGDNAYENDKWDDIAGFDFRLRFPGVQLYGELYGEDQAGYFPSDNAYTAGVYFPQLTADGSWDLRLEGSKTKSGWYGHGRFVNGWVYKDAIMGNAMGGDALQYTAAINHYLDNGDRLGLSYCNTDFARSHKHNMGMREYTINYSTKLEKNMYLDAMVGYAKLENVDHKKDHEDDTTMVGLGLRWDF